MKNDPKRKARASTTAAAAGKRFEGQSEGELTAMRVRGLVVAFNHTQPLFRAVGGGRFIPVKGGQADFRVLLPGPFVVAAECKSTLDGTLARSEFTVGEVADLTATADAGGLALVLIEFRFAIGGWQWFGVPWRCMPWKAVGVGGSAGGQSVAIEDLVGWELRRPLWIAPFVKLCPACRSYRLIGRRSCCPES